MISISYTVLTAAGVPLRRGYCSKEELALQADAGRNQSVVEGHLPEPVYQNHENYTAKRAREYPPIGEQLDAIWAEMQNGPAPRTEAARQMLARVLAVKARHPKP